MSFTTDGHGNGNGSGGGAGALRPEDYAPVWPMVPGTRKIGVTINGEQVEAEEGQTILQACRVLGIDVPTLCYEPKLAPYGACRICVVEVEGSDDTPISCGTQIAEGMVITTHSERLIENRRMVLELIFSDHDAYCLPPCQFKCPTRVDIPGYLKQNTLGNWEEATRILKRSLPFPAILGRVCPAPCETHCRREEVDTAIAIRDSHRYCADRVLEVDAPAPIPWPKDPDTGRRVAVIGAGPAGLTVAYYLQLRGHHCDVFEAEPEQGGMLRYGIPEYRLPNAWMDRELDHVWELGATLKPNMRLGREFRIADLLRRGLHRHRLLQVERAGHPRRGRRGHGQRPGEPLQLHPRAGDPSAAGLPGGGHRRRVHLHRLHPHQRPAGRRGSDAGLPPRPQGHASPGRGARGHRGGCAGHLPGRADPHHDRREEPGDRRRVPAHEAGRA
jgi:ferredoxin